MIALSGHTRIRSQEAENDRNEADDDRRGSPRRRRDRRGLEQLRAGMDVEFEHGSHDPQTDVTGDDPIVTGKIALAHMKEFPDYYERLERMEREADREWAEKS